MLIRTKWRAILKLEKSLRSSSQFLDVSSQQKKSFVHEEITCNDQNSNYLTGSQRNSLDSEDLFSSSSHSTIFPPNETLETSLHPNKKILFQSQTNLQTAVQMQMTSDHFKEAEQPVQSSSSSISPPPTQIQRYTPILLFFFSWQPPPTPIQKASFVEGFPNRLSLKRSARRDSDEFRKTDLTYQTKLWIWNNPRKLKRRVLSYSITTTLRTGQYTKRQEII